jgi:hypothetical protein
MNMLHHKRPDALARELVPRTPATLSEMIEAVRQRGWGLNEIEMAAAIGTLINGGRAEVLPPVRQMRRNAKSPTRYAAA